MKKIKQPFDPALLSVYNRGNTSESNLDSRWLFYQLNQINNKSEILPLAYQFIAQSLKLTEQQYAQSFISEYSEKNLTALKPLSINSLSEQFLTESDFHECLKQFAAVQLTQPCWLHNISQISCCQSITAVKLMDIYLQLTRNNESHNLYHSLLLKEGINIPVLYSYQYHHKADISTGFIDFSTTQQSLAYFPRIFFAEILGFTLAYLQMPSLIEVFPPYDKLPPTIFKQQKLILHKQLAPLLKSIIDYLDLYPQQQQVLWQRIQTGFWLYQLRMQQCRDQFRVGQDLRLPQVKPDKTLISPVDKKQALINYEKLTNRELYYYLVNADLFPNVLTIAKVKTAKLLQLNTLFNQLPFKNYSHQQFDDFINNIYQTEVKAYQPLTGKPLISKSAYIWGIEQIAPMILIDGCWLQNCYELQHSHPEIYQILFTIYTDEIGNGKRQQNHCYIFQQLLKSLSIDVPPVYSKEITTHSNFINSAFDLPTYMLALSLHTQHFLPELLGLNMAIELSGLGKDYLQLIDEWNYWEIDTTIANIHVSIDNYAEGHTFLAKKAIQLYLDDILNSTGDSKTVDKHWKRIYSGYTSLRFVGQRFKFVLPIYYMMKKIKS